MSAGEILLVNPRRRKRRTKSRKSRRVSRRRSAATRVHRRRRRHSNPRFSLRGVTSMVIPAATGAAGAVLLDVALAYVPLPEDFKSGWMGTGVKAAGALGLGLAAGKLFGKKTGVLFTAGALTVIAYQVIRGLATQTLGDKVKGLSGPQDFVDYQRVGAYMQPQLMNGATGMDVNLGYVNPAGVLDEGGDGLGAYMTDMGM